MADHIEFFQRQLDKAMKNLRIETARGHNEQAENIAKKICHYHMAIKALERMESDG